MYYANKPEKKWSENVKTYEYCMAKFLWWFYSYVVVSNLLLALEWCAQMLWIFHMLDVMLVHI